LALVIIILAIIGFFTTFGLVAFCFWRRRKRKQAVISAGINNLGRVEDQHGSVEVVNMSRPEVLSRFKENIVVGEMSAEDEARELSSQTQPLELDDGEVVERLRISGMA
jgi:hypothetical protein